MICILIDSFEAEFHRLQPTAKRVRIQTGNNEKRLKPTVHKRNVGFGIADFLINIGCG